MKAESFRKSLIFAFTLQSCLACITFFVLMLSAYKIRKFYKEKKLIEELNTKVMVMHVFAFAGVIASSIFNNVTKDLYYIDPQNEEASVLYNASIFIMAVMLVVTQVLLCAIFW